jgi:flagellar protein FlaG
MINPITPNPAALAGTPITTDSAPAPNRPEPAQKVTAAEQALDARLSPQANQTSPALDINAKNKALDEVNGRLQAWSTGMQFRFDEDANRIVVSIIDNHSGEVLRTVPSEAVLQVAKMIVQLQGQGVDTKA